ncbi:MAG: lactate utilization protein [Anaerovoracaceae bacterium]|jgi:hypothetical protein|nr:LUD domain-containing protein [Clostridiales bacterium]
MDIRDVKFPPLSKDAHNVHEIRKKFFRQNGEIAVKNLRKNNFDAVYCDSLKEGRDALLDLVKEGSIVAFGDSHTIFSLDLEPSLKDKKCTLIPYTCAVNKTAFVNNMEGFNILGDSDLTLEILKSYMTANVFLLSANAITVRGEIVNIDGAGNRIAGSIFGPDRIVVVAGANKVVPSIDAALSRIRDVAAQMNNIKYDNELSCNKAGYCLECANEERNCNVTAIYHKKPVASDFHVIIIGEELGF